jgi:predicted dehydrogenase
MNTGLPTPRRQFLRRALASSLALPALAKPLGANGDVRVAVIGFRGRGNGHINELLKVPGVRLVALCDVDSEVMNKKLAELDKRGVKPRAYRDFRECCADPQVDAVTIATPNHSHVLIALHALRHGKHVYVEKPVSHNLLESAQLMKAATTAAAKGLVVQHGMQRRSDLGWAQAMEWLRAGNLGKPLLSHALVHGLRPSIEKVGEPQPPPASVDYPLWSAPRPPLPILRKQFHYDWHWQWAYGNGDIGNQGPHQYDVARWALGDPDVLPATVMSFGNRWGVRDDGQSANCQMAFHPYAPVPLIMDKFGLPAKNLDAKSGEPPYRGIRTGNIVHCEGGYIAESKAYDAKGRSLMKFDQFLNGPDHMKNFIESVRQGAYIKDVLHIRHGHHAACLSHLANISYRLGKQTAQGEIRERLKGDPLGLELFSEFERNLAANGIDLEQQRIIAGPWLKFNPATLRFEGEFAQEANALCQEEYAAGFELI